jgi:FMN phosphatase YigB (HAD superfamily)
MLQNTDPELTNEQVFWSDFYTRLGDNSMQDLQPILEDFYAHRFNNLSRVARPGDHARPVVQKVLELDLGIVLATNPVFPVSAIRDRMNWAGVGDLPWNLVTSYENMHFCKPHREYYLEIAARLQLKPEQCLMVGNDVEKDILPAAAAGMRTYLVNDYLINKARVKHRADGSGSLSGLTGWLARFLPGYNTGT